jgi:hypothetical protein
MCLELTVDKDVESGKLLSLCDNAAFCLLVEIGLAEAAEIEGLDATKPVADGAIRDEWIPAFHLFSSFCYTAETAILESNYFDMDYRSELALMQETTFAPLLPTTTRMHFFTTKPLVDDAPERLHDFAARSEKESPRFRKPNYLGYTILRPREGRRIGRSFVTTDTPIRNDRNEKKLAASVVASQIRTAVKETVNLFGVYLVAVGVPFMEQDGNLIRCAHVSSWVCHYTAMLRDAVPRRSTAHLHRAGKGETSPGRQYPSFGVSSAELTSILRESDLPPEVLSFDQFSKARQPSWSDRVGVPEQIKQFEAAQKLAGTPEGDTTEMKKLRSLSDITWTRENVGAAICRYLNSGIPVILVRKNDAHTQVVVGYLRESDVEQEPSLHIAQDADKPGAWEKVPASGDESPEVNGVTRQPTSDVAYFIVNDDLSGPYNEVSLNELVEEIRLKRTEILVPLPRSLWMSGDTAERLGTRVLEQMTQSRVERFGAWDGYPAAERRDFKPTLEMFAEKLKAHHYTVRTYATTGVALKDSVAERIQDKELVLAVAQRQLPKYVWVVEAIDRQERKAGTKESVHAMIVIDASNVVSIDLNTTNAIGVLPPLFSYLPGHMQVPRYDIAFAEPVGKSGRINAKDEGWFPAQWSGFRTGRWNHAMLRTAAPRRGDNLRRGAVAGTTVTP